MANLGQTKGGDDMFLAGLGRNCVAANRRKASRKTSEHKGCLPWQRRITYIFSYSANIEKTRIGNFIAFAVVYYHLSWSLQNFRNGVKFVVMEECKHHLSQFFDQKQPKLMRNYGVSREKHLPIRLALFRYIYGYPNICWFFENIRLVFKSKLRQLFFMI